MKKEKIEIKKETKKILQMAGFSEEVRLVESGRCPLCKKHINMRDFKDDLSKKEYTQSGMCQTCQDSIFKEV